MNIRFSINGHPLDFDSEYAAGDGSSLVITNEDLSGTVRKVELAEGLCFFMWDFVIERAGDFFKEFSNGDEDKVYVIHYHPYPEYDRVEYMTNATMSRSAPRDSSLFILNCPGHTRSIYARRSVLRRVMLVFNQQWLLRQLKDLKTKEPASPHILELISSAVERSMSKGEVALVQMLFDIFQGHAYSLEVKAHVYQLISFLYRRAKISVHRNVASSYRPVMAKVERRILSALSGTMPSLEELARESLISVSTLKRQFKETFGVSIYDYYLQRKMDLAKELLQRGGLSVSAVAFQLGYESVSHFITIFKKIEGHPPGQLLKAVKEKGANGSAWD